MTPPTADREGQTQPLIDATLLEMRAVRLTSGGLAGWQERWASGGGWLAGQKPVPCALLRASPKGGTEFGGCECLTLVSESSAHPRRLLSALLRGKGERAPVHRAAHRAFPARGRVSAGGGLANRSRRDTFPVSRGDPLFLPGAWRNYGRTASARKGRAALLSPLRFPSRSLASAAAGGGGVGGG
ncbi:hypothetical protein AAFF_G00035560 [Aldrovandia affinis]|uniref:Uncharacterized protein n=1 Tax=Aldrovandia affinis TaxID=143900 RepID=A0AAD7WFV6_9TELE|nr:hypothetical protein AAFF_G00035560 [Aldrovandia affinis]